MLAPVLLIVLHDSLLDGEDLPRIAASLNVACGWECTCCRHALNSTMIHMHNAFPLLATL